ncbi:unnamed protein product [Mucor hiemalis]
MEDSSHELIEQLISKEKYCFDNTNPDGINSVREPVSPNPTLYCTSREDVVQVVSSVKNSAGDLTQAVENEVCELKVAEGVYKTPLIIPPLPASGNKVNDELKIAEGVYKTPLMIPPLPALDNKVNEIRDLEDKNTIEATESVAATKPKVVIDPQEITAEERIHCAEWFVGKPSKSPERYLRIRNHILECWENTKPEYLTKTAGRKNLSSCGDVNAVGRIHVYLQSIGAINVDCVAPMKRGSGKAARSDNGPAVKRAKKTPGYTWETIDDDEDNKGINKNAIIKQDGNARPQRNTKKPETYFNENNSIGYSNDPFTLVPVNFYKTDRSAPFTVSITSESLLVMDFHAHLAYTEIIGLLGGRIVDDAENGVQELKVEYVFPCRSTSTGIQCEMDPVSEMTARELFEKKGLSVVGWYHSHPTFEPEPSIRDIENQGMYQELFRQPSGLEPFIGIIITPYNSRNVVTVKSQIQIIHVSQILESKGAYRLPFACLHRIIPSKSISEDVTSTITQLVSDYKNHEHKIDMTCKYGHLPRLEKLMNTMRNHLFMNEEDVDLFLSDLKKLIQDF